MRDSKNNISLRPESIPMPWEKLTESQKSVFFRLAEQLNEAVSYIVKYNDDKNDLPITLECIQRELFHQMQCF